MKTYISVTVIYYRHMKPETHCYRHTDGQEASSIWNEMSVQEANLLMWKLIKLGGKNEYSANIFDNAISERRVTYWGEM